MLHAALLCILHDPLHAGNSEVFACDIYLMYICSATCLHRQSFLLLLVQKSSIRTLFSDVQLRDPVPGIFSAEMMVGSLKFKFLID